MAPPEWAEGTTRLDWLHQHGPSYRVAAHGKSKVAFLKRLYHDWFEKYHWSLNIKTEPDTTMVYIEPVDEESILKKNKAIVHRKASLSQWFWNQYDDDNRAKSNVISHNPFPTINASNLLLATKVKSLAKMKPRISQEHWTKEQGKMGPNSKPTSKVAVSQALMKEMWENESQEVHTEIEAERQRRYKVTIKEYECVQLVGSQSPQQFQNAIDHLYTYIQQISMVITDHTGFAITIIIGGPLPVTNSKLITSHIHKGETAGDNPLNFGSYAHETFNNVLMPKFAEFLVKKFSQDIHDVRSLSLLKSAAPEAVLSVANGNGNGNPTTATATSTSAATSIAAEHHGSTVSAHSLSLTPSAHGPSTPFAGGLDAHSLDGTGKTDGLDADDSDHGSEDEHATFGGHNNQAFSPSAQELRTDSTSSDMTSPLLLLPTFSSFSTASALSGMVVLLSPGTTDLSSPVLLTLSLAPDATRSKMIPRCSNNNLKHYGGKHKARMSDISAMMSPPHSKKHAALDESPAKSSPDSPTPLSDNPIQSLSEKWILPSGLPALPQGSLKPKKHLPKLTSETSDSGDKVKWYADLLEHMDELVSSKEWSILLANWILIEDLLGNSKESTSRFPTEHHPITIHQWVKCARSITWMPDLSDATTLSAYGNDCQDWWAFCQPKWRIRMPNSKEFVPLDGKGDWLSLLISGNNGLLLHVMSLAWWGNACLNNLKEKKKWTSVVKEVSWAFFHMHLSHTK